MRCAQRRATDLKRSPQILEREDFGYGFVVCMCECGIVKVKNSSVSRGSAFNRSGLLFTSKIKISGRSSLLESSCVEKTNAHLSNAFTLFALGEL